MEFLLAVNFSVLSAVRIEKCIVVIKGGNI